MPRPSIHPVITLRGCSPETVRAIHVEAAWLDVSPSEYATRLVALHDLLRAAIHSREDPHTLGQLLAAARLSSARRK